MKYKDKTSQLQKQRNRKDVNCFLKHTLDYVTQSDKKELTELLEELIEESSEEDYLITLINLEELIGKFLTNEFEDGNPSCRWLMNWSQHSPPRDHHPFRGSSNIDWKCW